MEQLTPWATATEPACCDSWSSCAYSLCSVRRQAPHDEKPTLITKRESPGTATETQGNQTCYCF